MTASCVDEDGLPVITYDTDRIEQQGMNALMAHAHLYLHPSGSVYKREWVDIEKLDAFLKNETDAMHFIYLFSLIRLSLSQRGDFYLMQDVIWVYTHTVRANTKSANSGGAKYIFDPTYNYMRMRGEFAWAARELVGEKRSYAFARIFGWYLITNTWEYYLDTRDIDTVKHYGIDIMDVDMDYERERYLKEVEVVEDKYQLNDDSYYMQLKEEYLQKNVMYCTEILKETKNDACIGRNR